MNFSEIYKEVNYNTARSSGAGGQHVNKVETKVELMLDIDNSRVLSEFQKERIKEELSSRINKNGILKVVSQEKRTQILNRLAAKKKFEKLLEKALKPKKKRRYKELKANSKKRLSNKKQNSEKKELRKKPRF